MENQTSIQVHIGMEILKKGAQLLNKSLRSIDAPQAGVVTNFLMFVVL